ncbi:MAG: hypothetical protein AAGD38_20270 [Acidobacteriota bacterium]
MRALKTLLTLLALLLISTAGVSAQVSCEEADAWAAANQDGLPTSISAFADVPEDFRAAAFFALDTEKKTAMWVEHIEFFVYERSDLSDADVEALRSSADFFAQPEAYSGSDLIGVAYKSFVERIQGSFSTEAGFLQNCNCDVTHPGCVRIWCIPTQGCGPFDCSGLWSTP